MNYASQGNEVELKRSSLFELRGRLGGEKSTKQGGEGEKREPGDEKLPKTSGAVLCKT